MDPETTTTSNRAGGGTSEAGEQGRSIMQELVDSSISAGIAIHPHDPAQQHGARMMMPGAPPPPHHSAHHHHPRSGGDGTGRGTKVNKTKVAHLNVIVGASVSLICGSP